MMRCGYEVFHPDIAALVGFYVDVLGFDAPGQSEVSGRDHVVVERDGVRVGCTRDPSASLAPRRPPTGSEIVFWVDNIHTEYERVRATGWRITDRLQYRPWGLRDFRVFDPTGQYIRITQVPPSSASPLRRSRITATWSLRPAEVGIGSPLRFAPRRGG